MRVKGLAAPYVSRGGQKLAGALKDFGIGVAQRVALDTGASTGGFTDCLLQQGAARVYAIDVGFGQLAGRLRADPRVVNMERTNIGVVQVEQLDPRPSLATVDLSYLSLKKAVPIIVRLLTADYDMLCLVKPLFEVQDMAARRTGKLEPAAYPEILHDLAAHMQALPLHVAGVGASRIRGSHDTDEFFLWLQPAAGQAVADIDAQIEQAVAAVRRSD